MNNDKQVPVARREGIVVRKIKDEVLIYDTDQDQAHCLSPAAAFVWEHCDGKLTVGEMAEIIQQNNPVLNVREAEAVVWFALDQLDKSKLLELPVPRPELSVTRRQIIKSSAVAALVALPIVSTIIAPTAAQASTCQASGQGCSTSAECCSGLCSVSVCA